MALFQELKIIKSIIDAVYNFKTLAKHLQFTKCFLDPDSFANHQKTSFHYTSSLQSDQNNTVREDAKIPFLWPQTNHKGWQT